MNAFTQNVPWSFLWNIKPLIAEFPEFLKFCSCTIIVYCQLSICQQRLMVTPSKYLKVNGFSHTDIFQFHFRTREAIKLRNFFCYLSSIPIRKCYKTILRFVSTCWSEYSIFLLHPLKQTFWVGSANSLVNKKTFKKNIYFYVPF